MKQIRVFLLACLTAVAVTSATYVAYAVLNPVSPCSTPFKAPVIRFINATSALVYAFATNSTGTVCVQFSQLPSELTPYARRLVNGTYVSAANLSVTPHQLTPILGGSSTVAYTMTLTHGTKAIYDLFLPSPCFGPGVLLAAGYSAHELNDTILRFPSGPQYTCPAAGGQYPIVGTFNLEIVRVRAVTVPCCSAKAGQP